MSAQDNAERVRRGYDAFNTGDLTALAELIADEVVWHVPGRSALSGDHKGREATFAYLGQLAQLSDGTMRANLEDLVAGGETVVARQTNTARHGDKELHDPACLVFEMSGGRIVETREYHYDQYAMDEFWA
jgi:ketosteroid isomerase-like protein